MSGVRKIYGVGINDVDAPVSVNKVTCRYYKTWSDMLRRCCCLKYKLKNPSYKDAEVCESWLYFSNFKRWMEAQDWEGKHLDKDLLVRGNKLYSPDTCVFIDAKINSFILEKDSCRGEYPLGVYFQKASGKFMALCGNPITGKREYLGLHDTPEDAHLAWVSMKDKLSNMLADSQENARVAEALRNRYKSNGKPKEDK